MQTSVNPDSTKPCRCEQRNSGCAATLPLGTQTVKVAGSGKGRGTPTAIAAARSAKKWAHPSTRYGLHLPHASVQAPAMQKPVPHWWSPVHGVAPQVMSDGHAHGPALTRASAIDCPTKALSTAEMSLKLIARFGITTFGWSCASALIGALGWARNFRTDAAISFWMRRG